jgi:hypothetical protein
VAIKGRVVSGPVAATKQIEAIGVLARWEKLTAEDIVIELERAGDLEAKDGLIPWTTYCR